jgi:hypothetical protein
MVLHFTSCCSSFSRHNRHGHWRNKIKYIKCQGKGPSTTSGLVTITSVMSLPRGSAASGFCLMSTTMSNYLPTYQPLLGSHKDEQTTPAAQAQNTNKLKKNIFWAVAVVTILYAALSGIRHISQSNFKYVKWLGGCHGSQRNLSGLPTHYVLPSGDKIPAVALGTGKYI